MFTVRASPLWADCVAYVTQTNHDVVRPSHDTAKIIVEVFRRWVLPQSAD
jgi:hypothetical protein